MKNTDVELLQEILKKYTYGFSTQSKQALQAGIKAIEERDRAGKTIPVDHMDRGYHRCREIALPIIARLQKENEELREYLIRADEKEYIAKVEQYTKLEAKYNTLKEEKKRLEERAKLLEIQVSEGL